MESEQVKRESQVDAELESMSRAISLLEEKQSTLYSLLSPVLRPESQTEKEDEKEPESLVKVANRVRTERARIQRVIAYVDSIIERLEI